MATGKKIEKLTLEEKLERALVPAEEQPYEVPENWCWTYLKNIAQWGSGGTPSRKNSTFYDGNIPWVKTGELEEDYIYDTEEKISEEAIQKSSAKLFPAETVLLAMYGATIGKTAILGVDAATNQACACAVCNSSMYNKYLFYYLRLQKDNFIKQGKGGAQPNISQNIIKCTCIPLPSKAEQQRIVEQIESLFAKLDEVKEKVQLVQNCSDDNFVSAVHEALSGNLTEGWRKQKGISKSGWRKAKLGNLGCLERGRSKHRPRNDSRLFGGPYPFIQTGDVAEADVYIEKHKQTLSEFGFAQSRMFPRGTLCITIAANIGDVAILAYDCCFPDSVVGFTPYKDVESKYIYYMMSELQKEIEANAPATAQKNINLKILNDIDITLPSVIEQRKIIAILDDLYDKKRQVKEKTEQIVGTIDIMKMSILAKAFRGELGTNNPEEESAIELLKTMLVEA